MQRDPRKLLYDVVAACRAIGGFCRDRTPEEYDADLMLRSACERQFEIIGEAMTRLRASHDGVFNRVDDGLTIIAFRNRLIHGYDTVDPAIVWDVIQTKLPRLERTAERLMREGD